MADLGRLANSKPSKATKSTMSPLGNANADPFDMKLTIAALPEQRSDIELPAILIRKLPPNFDAAQLRSLLVFAEDLDSHEFIPTVSEDQGFKTAIARFRRPSAAYQAQTVLQGKLIDTARLLTEPLRSSPGSIGEERRYFDQTTPRAQSGSSSTSASRIGQYSMNHVSPPETNGYAGPPHKDYFPDERHRISGREVIGEDGPDDETSNILKDPLGYAQNGLQRRNTDQSRYGHLSLNTTGPAPPPHPGYTSPPNTSLRSPVSTMTGTAPPSYRNHQRTDYPPVNPADQNPPCNTLYVGNLPIDTSEDELKAIFSKQRGYKRLCFRTKQNGPMCFVEFEDVSFATKSLNELYGVPLHNSAHRGGIRLSFSKNPLGVRSGQPGGMNGPMSPMSPGGHFSGMNGAGMQPFTTANGPPPGIPTPPGIPMSSPGPSSMSPNSGVFPGGPMSPNGLGYSIGPMNPGAGGPYPPGGGWPSGYNHR